MKDVVIGAVARDGKVTANLIHDISAETIANFIRNNVDIENSTLYTYQYNGISVNYSISYLKPQAIPFLSVNILPNASEKM